MGTIKYDKSTVTSSVSTVQYEDDIVKCEKKIRELGNMTKVQSHVILILVI